MFHFSAVRLSSPTLRLRAPQQRYREMLALLGALLVFAGLLVSAWALPLPPQPAAAPSTARVKATVLLYLNEWQPQLDTLVTLESGVQVKSSHVHGIEIDGVRYYYRLRHGFNYGPLSRGAATGHAVVTVLDPGTQGETEVYRLK